MTAAGKKAVSARMKKYWAERRAAKAAAAASAPQAAKPTAKAKRGANKAA